MSPPPPRPAPADPRPAAEGPRRTIEPLELVGLVGLLVLAAAARFLDLPTRGMWDADQGHDMFVLSAFVQHGVIPQLGPPTSIGDFHHGVLYYYLLAPAAWLSGGDPVGVVAAIAVAGVAAVAVTWWLARSIGGPVAGFVAGLLVAVSAAAIDESTFLWNPNLIALSSGIAFAAAWRAWTTRRARWWLLAAIGQAVTMHCHVLGVVLLVPLGGLLLADLRRSWQTDARTPLLRAALVGILVLGVSYLPLIAYELSHDFAESRAALAFLAGGGGSSESNVAVRLGVVGLRILSWPLTGLVTAAPGPALLAAAAMIAIVVWRLRRGSAGEREVVAWFGATLVWSIVVLAVISPSLATVVEGLPNDHYHAFLDPLVFALAGLGAAGLWRRPTATEHRIYRLAPIGAMAAVLAFNVAIWPPRVAPDGGWPAAQAAARRVAEVSGGRQLVLLGLPDFKPGDALGYPLSRIGRTPVTLMDPMGPFEDLDLVVACDRLFEATIGAACGGPAEDAAGRMLQTPWRLIDRFDESTRTSISIYEPVPSSP